MAVTAALFGAFIDHLAQKRIDVDSDSIKVALVGAGYTPNLDTHDFFNDITNEASGTGYTAGGVALASVTWAYNATTNTWTLDAADAAWTGATVAARYAVIYDDTPATAATKPLIALVDFGEVVSATGGPFTIQWNASGILTIAA